MRGALLLVVGVLMLTSNRLAVAEDQASSQNVFGLPAGAIEKGGTLVICGGGNLPDSVYDEFVQLAGGENARLVLIPSAYDYGTLSRIRRAFGGWREYKVKSFDFLHTDDPQVADTEKFARPLERATGVWIAGGAQARLTYRYGHSRVQRLLQAVVARGGVVGGTSAGASVLSQRMIRNGSSVEAVVDDGFGLASRMVIDQHFSERGRFPRLLGVLEEHPGQIGLGIDEGTGVILQGNRLRILGAGRATFCFGPVREGEGTTVHRLVEGGEAEVVSGRELDGIAPLELRRRYSTAKK